MTSFQFKGKYTDDSCLPTREQEGAVQFREPDMNKTAVIANLVSLGIILVLLAIIFLRAGFHYNTWGIVVSLLLLVPHEFLHGIWMNGDVYMYENMKKGMLFVVSTADHTKGRFIWVSIFPTLIFGFVPFALFLICPKWLFLGYLGAFSTCMGAGDFINIYLALTQMPKGSVTFLSGFHSYWYMPEK